MKRAIATGFVVVAGTLAVALTGCSGNSTTSPPTPIVTPVPFLVPGTTSTFSGTYAENITYASPNPKLPNSKASYTVIDTQAVSSAPAGAPAPYEVNRKYKYSVVNIPTEGIELQQRTVESYESSSLSGGMQTIALASSTTATSGIDLTANRIEGNGPYSYSSTNTATYVTPRQLFVFPLMQGSTNLPLARTEMLMEKSSNGSGQIYLQRNTKTTYANSGAFTTTGSIGQGETTDVTANANGTASIVNTGKTPTTETIGLPVANDGTYTIPVTVKNATGTKTYQAADWYPGNAAPPSPLASTTQTVVGAAAVPTACALAKPVSNAQEVTTTSTSLNVVAGTYTTSQSEIYLASNAVVCRMTSSKTLNYAVQTGALFSTIVDSYVEGLSSTKT